MKSYKYSSFIKKHSDLYSFKAKNFFNLQDLLAIWKEKNNATPMDDIRGRPATLFGVETSITKPLIIDNMKKKFKKIFDPEDLDICNISLCYLERPTLPHIDGHYPFYVLGEENYCMIKICIVPIAFDTTEQDTANLTTSVVTFKQHYHRYTQGGIEFDHLFKKNKKYDNFSFESSNGNKILRHQQSFINDSNKHQFKHMQTELNLPLTYGLDIENIDTLHLGDITSMNPFQIHCTTDYDKFIYKWILRFVVVKKI